MRRPGERWAPQDQGVRGGPFDRQVGGGGEASVRRLLADSRRTLWNTPVYAPPAPSPSPAPPPMPMPAPPATYTVPGSGLVLVTVAVAGASDTSAGVRVDDGVMQWFLVVDGDGASQVWADGGSTLTVVSSGGGTVTFDLVGGA